VALSEIASVVWPIIQPHADQLSPQLRRIFRVKVEGQEPDLAGYVGALAWRVELERAVAAWLERNPIAVCPVAPTPAFEIGSETVNINGTEVEEVDLMTLCTYVNLMGLPAAAVPVKRSAEGLPVGVQVIGRRGHEMEVLAVAKELEEAFGGWMDPEAVKQDVA
jgi:amidase